MEMLEPIVDACALESYPGEIMERRVAAGEFDPACKPVRALNPRGTPPAIRLRPMAARPASLEGRTIYLVDVRFMNGSVFLGEIQKVFAEQFPGVKTVLRQKRGGYTEDDPELWAEIEANAGLLVMAIGHCSTCAPAVAVHCMNMEDRGIPTAPLVTSAFSDLVKAVTYKAGMPNLRFTCTPHPVGGKPPEVLRGYVLGMNSGLGALGPFNHANATIGRAYGLLSRNLGGGAVPGTTYLGSQGNPLNYANTCFAENEERSPWAPFHVQKGFKAEESVVSIFRGRTFSHLLEVRDKTWKQQLLNQVAGFTPTPRTNLTLLVEPLAARTLKQREGFDTKEKLAQWYHENSTLPGEVYWDYQLVINYIEPQARKGVEPFASYLKLPKDAPVPRFAEPDKIGVVVVGGEKNAYWFATDFGWLKSVSVDAWR